MLSLILSGAGLHWAKAFRGYVWIKNTLLGPHQPGKSPVDPDSPKIPVRVNAYRCNPGQEVLQRLSVRLVPEHALL